MRLPSPSNSLANLALSIVVAAGLSHPLNTTDERGVSAALFAELEELARIVDITYCVGSTGLGIVRPFTCLSRCKDFPHFELIRTWNTGPLLSDSCGYIALDHGKKRVIAAFRGTYSVANTIADLSTVPQAYEPYLGPDAEATQIEDDLAGSRHAGRSGSSDRNTNRVGKLRCENCTVHMGFQRSWTNTRSAILRDLEQQAFLYPQYELNLVGHSLGGAVAALGGLEMLSRGWQPKVTTFGEPRVGNTGLATYINQRFNLSGEAESLAYRRVTHVDDPVPLLPLTEWGYVAHAGEIFISKSSLSPDIQDLEHCEGNKDVACIAGQDPTADGTGSSVVRKRNLLGSVKNELQDVMFEPWGIPSRYKLWELFFAHRDYFWRLGLCVPGGDPLGGGGKYEAAQEL